MDMLLPTCAAWARWKLLFYKEYCIQSWRLSSFSRWFPTLFLGKEVRSSFFLFLSRHTSYPFSFPERQHEFWENEPTKKQLRPRTGGKQFARPSNSWLLNLPNLKNRTNYTHLIVILKASEITNSGHLANVPGMSRVWECQLSAWCTNKWPHSELCDRLHVFVMCFHDCCTPLCYFRQVPWMSHLNILACLACSRTFSFFSFQRHTTVI